MPEPSRYRFHSIKKLALVGLTVIALFVAEQVAVECGWKRKLERELI